MVVVVSVVVVMVVVVMADDSVTKLGCRRDDVEAVFMQADPSIMCILVRIAIKVLIKYLFMV